MKLKHIKKTSCLAVSAFAFTILMNSCTKETPVNQAEESTIAASFKGGNEQLVSYLQKNIVYPEQAKNEGIEGISYVTFIIDENGKIDKVEIAKSSGNNDLDMEAVRAINEMPSWEPANVDGKATASTFTLPIKFLLPKK